MFKPTTLALLVGLTLAWTGAPLAATDNHVQTHALRYANAIEAGHRQLENWIRRDSAAAVAWGVAGIPPAESGWAAAWTEMGIRARFCDDTLVVYMGVAEAKGIGRNHVAVRVAPAEYAGDRTRRRSPLMWLDDGDVDAGGGNIVTLPACMRFDVPTGRAAFASNVADPWNERTARLATESQTLACAAGEWGSGVYQVRDVTSEVNGRGDAVGGETFGPWVTMRDDCQAEATAWQKFTTACSWDQGAPFNRTMNGLDFWRQQVRVTEAGDVPIGTAEYLSSTCWDRERDGLTPTPPDPDVRISSSSESRRDNCPTGYTGEKLMVRTVASHTVTYPWSPDDNFTRATYSPWSEASNSCQLVSGGGGGGGDSSGGDGRNDREPDNSGGKSGPA